MIAFDAGEVAELIRDAAATYVLPRFNKLSAGQIKEKAPGELVTVADLETEQALAPRLTALAPGSRVIGEEAAAHDTGLFELLRHEDPVWLIDPVDGTSNFAAGLPMFAVMVALVAGGEILGGWIHDPVRDVTAVAERGAGARLGAERLSVAGPESRPRFGNRQLVRQLGSKRDLVDEVFSYRCAGQEYLALAAGRTHFALYHRLFPWDHAPGVLLHREAGGYGRHLDGAMYTPLRREGGLLLAPDEASWHSMREALPRRP